jgi:hypothetical protein
MGERQISISKQQPCKACGVHNKLSALLNIVAMMHDAHTRLARQSLVHATLAYTRLGADLATMILE